MPTNIGLQLAETVENLRAPSDLAATVVRQSRSRRRRQFGAAGLIAAVAVTVGVVLPVTESSDSSNVSRLLPASPSSDATTSPPRSYANVDGVYVTALPPNFKPTGHVGVGKSNENGYEGQSQSFIAESSGSFAAAGNGPLLAVDVQRGFVADLDGLAKASPKTERRWVAVQGHRALLRQFIDKSLAGSATTRSSLEWVDGNTTLLVTAADGATLSKPSASPTGSRSALNQRNPPTAHPLPLPSNLPCHMPSRAASRRMRCWAP